LLHPGDTLARHRGNRGAPAHELGRDEKEQPIDEACLEQGGSQLAATLGEKRRNTKAVQGFERG
jgi:hypothetical protein